MLAASPGVLAEGNSEPSRLEWLLGSRLTGSEVLPKTSARFFWSTDGNRPIAGTTLEPYRTLKRLKASGSRVRVVASSDIADIAVYIERADLHPVTTRAVTIGGSAGIDMPGLHLDAGAPIVVERSGRISSRVAFRDGPISARGHLDSRAIDIDFVKPENKTAPTTLPVHSITRKTALRQRPGGGATIAVLDPKADSHLEIYKIRSAGQQSLVSYTFRYGTAVGWVATNRLGTYQFGFGLRGVGGGGGGSHRLRVAANTVLRSGKRGAVVGLTVKKAWLRRLAIESNWSQVVVPTQFGDLPLWINDERME